MVGSASTLAQPPRKELLPVPHLALGERPTAQFVLNPNPLAKSSRPDGISTTVELVVAATGTFTLTTHIMCSLRLILPLAN
jgi:hypothetical protein